MKTAFSALGSLSAAALLSACSISYSVESSGDMVSSVSRSSRPSESSRAKAQYEKDVAAFVASFADASKPADAYLAEIGRIAKQHRISDWEREPETFRAVGAGLREAGIPREALASFPLVLRLRREDQDALPQIEKAYDAPNP